MKTVSEYGTVENAYVDRVYVGTREHDGRGFFSILLRGDSWGQGAMLPWDRDTIDRLIEVCGADNLFACENKIVRVAWDGDSRRNPIAAIFHVLEAKGLQIRD